MVYVPLVSNYSYALPLLFVVVAGLLWWWTTRAMPPPHQVASPPSHSWKVNPTAAAYSSLQQERYLLAAFLLRERLAALARDRFGMTLEEMRTGAPDPRVPSLPPPLRLRRVLRDLRTAYRSAYVAEGMRAWDAFSPVTLPIRRRRAARDFERAAHGVSLVVAAWTGAT
jgi:hypothetical protein